MRIAAKSFLDGQGRKINAGDELPDDYDKTVIDHYQRLGLISETATDEAKKPGRKPRAASPAETKPAEPTETAGDAPASSADGAGQDDQQKTEQAQGNESA